MKSIKLLVLAPVFLVAICGITKPSFAESVTNSELNKKINNVVIPAQLEVADSETDSDEIEVEVTGKKAPFAPTVAPAYTVPKEQIQRQNPTTASELLRSLPGFAINDYGFGADIHTGTFLRGFSINQSSFQINGRSFGSNVNTYNISNNKT